MPKILIVDDERDVCFLLKKILKSNGYETRCCYTLQTCRETIADMTSIELILLDINLTDGNGLSLLEEKIIPEATKVIVMSARSHLADEAVDKGADLFMAKPFSPNKLLSVIQDYRQAS